MLESPQNLCLTVQLLPNRRWLSRPARSANPLVLGLANEVEEKRRRQDKHQQEQHCNLLLFHILFVDVRRKI